MEEKGHYDFFIRMKVIQEKTERELGVRIYISSKSRRERDCRMLR